MERIEKIIRQMIRWGTVFASLVMGGVLVLIVFTAIARLLGYTVAGAFELAETYMMIVGAFSLVYCESLGAQAKAEVLTDRVSPRTRIRFAIFTTFLTVFYWGVIFYAGCKMLLDKIAHGERTELLEVNVVPSRTLWMVSIALMCLLLIFRFLHHIKDAATGQEKDASHAVKGVSE
jgi:TRAP-type C4-dicarboxylate transport system permease small subunit